MPSKPTAPCTRCKLNTQRPNSKRGLCYTCSNADDLEKARVRAAEQHKRKMAKAAPRKLCACGCGEKCRAGATYFTTQHREDHERSQRDEHRQPRVYVKPPESQKLQRMSRAEKRDSPVLTEIDTEAERARVAMLLEKARRERVECNISRFLDDRYCVLDGRR